MKRWYNGLIFSFMLLFLALPFFRGLGSGRVQGDLRETVRMNSGWPQGVRGNWGCSRPWLRHSNDKHDTSMCWKKAGSGASLKLLKQKGADIILVHAPAAEKKSRPGGLGHQKNSDRIQ